MLFTHFLIVFTSIMTVMVLVLALATINDDGKLTGEGAFALVCFCILAFVSIVQIVNYDSKVVKNADEFFATRNETYKCDIAKYECQYRIKEWQADSVYWEEKLDKIFSEVKVSCVPDSGNFWKEVKENTKQ